RALSCIGAGAAAAACHPRLAPRGPTGLPPADRDAAVAWCRSTLPVSRTAMRFRWRYRDERVSGGGRGQIRLAPPDSLRLDYVATLGMASGAGVLIGDSLVWADPNKDFRSLVRAAATLWSAPRTTR